MDDLLESQCEYGSRSICIVLAWEDWKKIHKKEYKRKRDKLKVVLSTEIHQESNYILRMNDLIINKT